MNLDLRFVAFTKNDDGTISIIDIVETSYHYASFWARRFRRDPQVCRVWVGKPQASHADELFNNARLMGAQK